MIRQSLLRFLVLVSIILVAFSYRVTGLSTAAFPFSLADRDSDPVVLAGSELPGLLGLEPDRIVAFRYTTGWIQIPVQVDERSLVDFGIVYGLLPVGVVTLAYC